jgi:hypothetical protein
MSCAVAERRSGGLLFLVRTKEAPRSLRTRLEDMSHSVQAVVYHGNMQSSSGFCGRSKRNPPNCSIDDPIGNKTSSVVFTNWTLNFYIGPRGHKGLLGCDVDSE